jgi:hypothetical protein
LTECIPPSKNQLKKSGTAGDRETRVAYTVCCDLIIGFEGRSSPTIEDMVAKAELSKGTFCLYFRKNDEILAAINCWKKLQNIKRLGNDLKDDARNGKYSYPSLNMEVNSQIFDGI